MHPLSPDGGIGRRAGLKHQWGNPSRFEPGSGYLRSLANGCLQGIFIGGAEEGEKEGRRRKGEEREKKGRRKGEEKRMRSSRAHPLILLTK